jgi:hypothetical protein
LDTVATNHRNVARRDFFSETRRMHTFAKILVCAFAALGASACSTSRAGSTEPPEAPAPAYEPEDRRNPREVEQQLDELEETLVKHDAGEIAARGAHSSVPDANAARLPLRQSQRQ